MSSGGQTIWAERFGGLGYETGNAVAGDSVGNVIVAGYFSGTVDFGGIRLTATGNKDIFVAKYSSTGTYIWAKRFGGGSGRDSAANAVAVDSAGNVIVTGSYQGTINFGGGSLSSGGTSLTAVYLAKFSPSGTYMWAKSFAGGGQGNVGYGVAVDGSDNVIMTGSFWGYLSFGGPSLNSGGTTNTFIAKYSSTGTYIWSTNLISSYSNIGNSVTADSGGNVVVTGSFSGTVYFDPGLQYSATSVGSTPNIFLAKYSPTGGYLWSKSFGSSNYQYAYGVKTDSSANIIFTGNFTSGPIDFGGGSLTSGGTNSTSVFLAKFSPTGTLIWSKNFPTTGYNQCRAVAVDNLDDIVITGFFTSTTNFGGGPLATSSTSDRDIFVAKYSPNGSYLWAEQVGSTSYDEGYGVAVDIVGNVIATGYFMGTVDFGAGPLLSAGQQDVYLIKLQP